MRSILSRCGVAVAALCVAAAGAYQHGWLQAAGAYVGIGPPRATQVGRGAAKPASRIVVHHAPLAPGSVVVHGDPLQMAALASPEVDPVTDATPAVGGIRIPLSATMARKYRPVIVASAPESAPSASAGSQPSSPVATNGFSQAFGSMRTDGVSLGAAPSVQPPGIRTQGAIVSYSNRR